MRDSSVIHLIGYGSQAKAWAECLKLSRWNISVYLAKGSRSIPVAQAAGFNTFEIDELPKNLLASPSDRPHLIAFLCPDDRIGMIYREYLANISKPMTLVLAHGFAVYADDLKAARSEHRIALFAPKAIGPKLSSSFKTSFEQGGTHRLVAGIIADVDLQGLPAAMGFAPTNLVPATFEQEALGDLISEQGLLCGGVYTLMEWTLQAMRDAGIPDGLIREECFTELELIAGLIRERGPAATFGAISQAAQSGAIAMRRRLNESGAKQAFDSQIQEILSKKFVDFYRAGEWKKDAAVLVKKLEKEGHHP